MRTAVPRISRIFVFYVEGKKRNTFQERKEEMFYDKTSNVDNLSLYFQKIFFRYILMTEGLILYICGKYYAHVFLILNFTKV